MIVQVCTDWEHVSHPTVALCAAMDRQREMLASLLDGVDGYLDTLKHHLATVRELSDDMRSSYRYNKKAQLSLTNPRDACEQFARFT